MSQVSSVYRQDFQTLFLYTHKSVRSQIIIKEASTSRLWEQTKVPDWKSPLVLPLGVWGSSQKREKKKYKRQKGQGHQKSTAHRFQLSRAHRGNHRAYMDLPYVICICVMDVRLVFLCDS